MRRGVVVLLGAMCAAGCAKTSSWRGPNAADAPVVVPIALTGEGSQCRAAQEPDIGVPTLEKQQRLIWVITNDCDGRREVVLAVVANKTTGGTDEPFVDDDDADGQSGRRVRVPRGRTRNVHVRLKDAAPQGADPAQPNTYKYEVRVTGGQTLDPDVIADWP